MVSSQDSPPCSKEFLFIGGYPHTITRIFIFSIEIFNTVKYARLQGMDCAKKLSSFGVGDNSYFLIYVPCYNY